MDSVLKPICVLLTVSVIGYAQNCNQVYHGLVPPNHHWSTCNREYNAECRIDLVEEYNQDSVDLLKTVLNTTYRVCFGCAEDNFIGLCKTLIVCAHDAACYKTKQTSFISEHAGTYYRYKYGCTPQKSCITRHQEEVVIYEETDLSNGDPKLRDTIKHWISHHPSHTHTTQTHTTHSYAPHSHTTHDLATVPAIIASTQGLPKGRCTDVFLGLVHGTSHQCEDAQLDSSCKLDLRKNNDSVAITLLQSALNSKNKVCFGCTDENLIGECTTLIVCSANSACYKTQHTYNAGSLHLNRFNYGCALQKSCLHNAVIFNTSSLSNGDRIEMQWIHNVLSTTTTSTSTTTPTTATTTTPALTSDTTAALKTTATTPVVTITATTPGVTATATTPSVTTAAMTPAVTTTATTPSTTTVTTTSTTDATTTITTIPSTVSLTTRTATSVTETTTNRPTIELSTDNSTNVTPLPSAPEKKCEDNEKANCDELKNYFDVCSGSSNDGRYIAYHHCRKSCDLCNVTDTWMQQITESTVKDSTIKSTTPVLPSDLPPCQDQNTSLCLQLKDYICKANDVNTREYAIMNCSKTCNLCSEYFYTILKAQATTTIATTTKTVPAVQRKCIQCGSIKHNIPCGMAEIAAGVPSTCPQGKEYCQTDLYQDQFHNQMVYKRCVDEPTCAREWFDHSSDHTYCVDYEKSPIAGKFNCHFCCTSDGCNTNIVPDVSTLYLKP